MTNSKSTCFALDGGHGSGFMSSYNQHVLLALLEMNRTWSIHIRLLANCPIWHPCTCRNTKNVPHNNLPYVCVRPCGCKFPACAASASLLARSMSIAVWRTGSGLVPPGAYEGTEALLASPSSGPTIRSSGSCASEVNYQPLPVLFPRPLPHLVLRTWKDG